MAPPKIGLHTDGDPWEPDEFALVEEVGFDILTTGEHIVFHRPILDVVTVLAYAAAVTKHIKLAPSTIILPLRHPTIMAKELTSLDVLSKGRLIASIGIGGDYPREFPACGVSTSQRGVRSNESLEIIRKYWSGKRFSYDGKIFQLDDVDMLPQPVQEGGPPIWVCGRTTAAMRRAVALGDGWQPYMFTADHFRDSVRTVQSLAADAGRTLQPDFAYTSFVYVSMDDNVERARQYAIEQLTYRFDLPFEKIVDKYCAYGPPSRIVDTINAYVEAGSNNVVIALVMPPEARREWIERFAKNVLPSLKMLTVVDPSSV
ncbi:MAG: TIGR03619 family F420-dependent LLM class oxidoreductase [Chromatiales bacterium]|jgi:probable F420-dependent oxidoreductase|nr:TIGR03619 family F420-dependent LLM class oxidoreductase [Chromatiales bacterium]